MKKLHLTHRLFAVIAFFIIIANAIFTVYSYNQLNQLIEKRALAEAKVLHDYFISMRNIYQRQFLSSGLDLNDSTVGFLPAHASTLISDEFSKRTQAGVTIRNVTDRPRNPKNKADAVEEEAMNYFAARPDQNERMITTVQNGREIFFYTAPLRIEPYCMQCHGKKEEVLPFIAKRYDTAYDYKIGNVRGVTSIKMSKEALAQELITMFYKRMTVLWSFSFVFLILFWLALRRIIYQEAQAADKESVLQYNTVLEQRVKEETQKRLKQERTILEYRKLAAMGEMLTGIAHNWRQPLNALGLIIQDAKEAFDYNEITEEYLNTMVQNSMSRINHMSRMIDNFRSFTKTDEEHSFFEASKVVRDTMELMKSQMDELCISFVVQTQNDEQVVGGYQNTLKKALYNVLSNAKDAITQRRESDKIFEPKIVTTISKKDDDKVSICIFNNGGNIPNEVMERLFEPYFTTKEQGKGVGLGLYMSRMEIEERMSGTLTAQNKEDGAEFCLTVPL